VVHLRDVHRHHDQAAAAHAQVHQEALRAAAEARAALEAARAAADDSDTSDEVDDGG
jgi:hypothetical protein